MEKKEYNCTECGTSNFITLLGSKEVVFKKKCNSCQIELEMTLDENEKLSIKPIEKKEKGLNKKKRFIHLICRIKGEKVYDDKVEVKDVDVKVEDAELVVETIVKKVKLEIKENV